MKASTCLKLHRLHSHPIFSGLLYLPKADRPFDLLVSLGPSCPQKDCLLLGPGTEFNPFLKAKACCCFIVVFLRRGVPVQPTTKQKDALFAHGHWGSGVKSKWWSWQELTLNRHDEDLVCCHPKRTEGSKIPFCTIAMCLICQKHLHTCQDGPNQSLKTGQRCEVFAHCFALSARPQPTLCVS